MKYNFYWVVKRKGEHSSLKKIRTYPITAISFKYKTSWALWRPLMDTTKKQNSTVNVQNNTLVFKAYVKGHEIKVIRSIASIIKVLCHQNRLNIPPSTPLYMKYPRSVLMLVGEISHKVEIWWLNAIAYIFISFFRDKWVENT